MTLSGSAAIDYLAVRVSREDVGESSHWRKFHSDFRFAGDGFTGIVGFGAVGRPHGLMRGLAHRALQRRFRAMGAGFEVFPEADAAAQHIIAAQKRAYNLDVLRQALTVGFLRHHLGGALSRETTACVIGDGFGLITALLLATNTARRVVLINLTKTLLVDLWYLRLWLGDAAFSNSVALLEDGAQAPSSADWRVLAIQAADHVALQSVPIDLAINIASMQEMNPPVIDQYFNDLRTVARKRRLAFYCCNRLDKALPDGTHTRFFNYSWRADDRIVVDELCPWHQQYYVSTPPFYRRYDGPIHHRLAWLAPTLG